MLFQKESSLLLLPLLAFSSSVWAEETTTEGNTNGSSPLPEIPIPSKPVVPSPNGPLYGLPFEPSSNLPFAVSGSCESGKFYVVTKPEDVLTNYGAELECLYNAGVAPGRVPQGPLYGSVLSIYNSKMLNGLVGQTWKGKYINKTECGDGEETAFVGWNNLNGLPTAPFLAYVGDHNLNLAPGEYEDGRKALVFQYGVDLPQLCPQYRRRLLQGFGRAVLQGTSWSGTSFPLNQMVDVVRLIGRQEDGADIYLGKAYLKDPFRDDGQAVTVAYFLLVSYDQEANPLNIISGLPTTIPSPHRFKYIIPGALDLFLRLSPIDNMITSPARTIRKVVQGSFRGGANVLRFASSLPFGLRHIRTNARDFQTRFYKGVNSRKPTK